MHQEERELLPFPSLPDSQGIVEARFSLLTSSTRGPGRRCPLRGLGSEEQNGWGGRIFSDTWKPRSVKSRNGDEQLFPNIVLATVSTSQREMALQHPWGSWIQVLGLLAFERVLCSSLACRWPNCWPSRDSECHRSETVASL